MPFSRYRLRCASELRCLQERLLDRERVMQSVFIRSNARPENARRKRLRLNGTRRVCAATGLRDSSSLLAHRLHPPRSAARSILSEGLRDRIQLRPDAGAGNGARGGFGGGGVADEEEKSGRLKN